MQKFRLVLGVLLATAAAAALAADKEVESLLGSMRQAYKSVKSATYVAESHFPGPNGKETVFVNTFRYKTPGMIRIDITAPGQKTKVSKIADGKKVAIKLPGASTPQQMGYSIDNFESNLPANLEALCFFDFDRQLSTAAGKNMEKSKLKVLKGQSWKGKIWTVLEETAPQQAVVCKYYVSPTDHFIWRTTVYSTKAKRQVSESFLKSFAPGDLSASVFKL